MRRLSRTSNRWARRSDPQTETEIAQASATVNGSESGDRKRCFRIGCPLQPVGHQAIGADQEKNWLTELKKTAATSTERLS
jgi:hypothetical protein